MTATHVLPRFWTVNLPDAATQVICFSGKVESFRLNSQSAYITLRFSLYARLHVLWIPPSAKTRCIAVSSSCGRGVRPSFFFPSSPV